MKITAILAGSGARFDRLSLRERVLVFGGILAAVFVAWNLMLMERLENREKALSLEINALQTGIGATGHAAETLATSDPRGRALASLAERQAALAAVDTELRSESSGLIPPSRMLDVIHDVLGRQHGLVLVSLRSLEVTSLVAPGDANSRSSGLYLHPVELIFEGRYLDVVTYLRALEALPWRFYWRGLDLETTSYPLNRVRIELSTVSMEKEWIGV